MRILYPLDPLNPRKPDEFYADEFSAAAADLPCSLFSFEDLGNARFKPRPGIIPGESVLYRGWMLSVADYAHFIQLIASHGARAVTTPEHYQRCHHLTGWYEQCREFTAETHFFADDERLADHITDLSWDRYFVKDFVKSNTDALGSMADSPTEALRRVERIRQYRGGIQGGIAIRRVEHYHPNSEARYFVAHGQVYSATESIPDIVQRVACRIDAPFFSVDSATTEDGMR